jgi:hypothetical protein
MAQHETVDASKYSSGPPDITGVYQAHLVESAAAEWPGGRPFVKIVWEVDSPGEFQYQDVEVRQTISQTKSGFYFIIARFKQDFINAGVPWSDKELKEIRVDAQWLANAYAKKIGRKRQSVKFSKDYYQAKDSFGELKFDDDGQPVMRFSNKAEIVKSALAGNGEAVDRQIEDENYNPATDEIPF